MGAGNIKRKKRRLLGLDDTNTVLVGTVFLIWLVGFIQIHLDNLLWAINGGRIRYL